MARTRKSASRPSVSKAQPPSIPAEVSDSALISAKLVQRIHRGLLMCHLLEERVAANGNQQAIHRLRRGDGAMVVGSTIGLGARDTVITLGDTLLPHITRGTPLTELIAHLAQKPPARKAIARQREVARGAVASAASDDRVVLVLCTDFGHAADTVALADDCTAGRLPLVALLQSKEPVSSRLGTPVVPVEAHDAIAIYRVTQEAIWRARRKGGPTIVAALHSIPQPAPREHFESEALVHLREYMQRHGAWDEAATGRLRAKLEAELDEAFAAANS